MQLLSKARGDSASAWDVLFRLGESQSTSGDHVF